MQSLQARGKQSSNNDDDVLLLSPTDDFSQPTFAADDTSLQQRSDDTGGKACPPISSATEDEANNAVDVTSHTRTRGRLRFYQPFDYVPLPDVVCVPDTADRRHTDNGAYAGQSQSITIRCAEDDDRAAKRFAICLKIVFGFLSVLYAGLAIAYIFLDHLHRKVRGSVPSLAVGCVFLTCVLFVSVGVKVARESIEARQKRLHQSHKFLVISIS